MIVSNSNELKLKFESNSGTEMKGFAATLFQGSIPIIRKIIGIIAKYFPIKIENMNFEKIYLLTYYHSQYIQEKKLIPWMLHP